MLSALVQAQAPPDNHVTFHEQGQLVKLRREESQTQNHFDASYWGEVLKEQEQMPTEAVAQAMAAPLGGSPGPPRPLHPSCIASAVSP